VSLHPDTLIARDPSLIAAPVGDELVMLSVEQGKYFALNEGAAAVWRGIEHPMTFEDLCAEILERYDVSPDECRRDVSRFVEELHAKGLVQVVPSAP
jgi:hypothetical protein